MDIRPKWMKEKVSHEDKADEFGEDTGVQECIDDERSQRTLAVPVGLIFSDPIPARLTTLRHDGQKSIGFSFSSSSESLAPKQSFQ